MGISLIFFGLFTDTLLAVLVGMLGARRNIGFGWAFLLSLLLTPLVGLIIVLLSDKKGNAPVEYGCLGNTFGCFGTIILVLLVCGLLSLLVTMLMGGALAV